MVLRGVVSGGSGVVCRSLSLTMLAWLIHASSTHEPCRLTRFDGLGFRRVGAGNMQDSLHAAAESGDVTRAEVQAEAGSRKEAEAQQAAGSSGEAAQRSKVLHTLEGVCVRSERCLHSD